MRLVSGMFLVVMMATGCAAWFDALVPAHERSATTGTELICVSFPDAPREPDATGFAPVVAALAPVVIGAIVDYAVGAFEAEAKRYSASYSGRATSYLLAVSRSGAADRPAVRLWQRKLRLDRYHGDAARRAGCPGTAEESSQLDAARTLSFEGEMSLSEAQTIRITPTLLDLRRTKAKVLASRGEVDINVQVRLALHVQDKPGVTPKRLELAAVDFPIGKLNLGQQAVMLLHHLRTEHIPIPAIDYSSVPAGQRVPVAPLNLTITVMESEDFGDVIGTVARVTSSNRQKIVDGLVRTLGLGNGEGDKR